jgi:beta propeller repeat protein
VTNLSNNGAGNSTPHISGSSVVWTGDADGNLDIYLHDGTSLTNLSNNTAYNYNALISGSNVVWRAMPTGTTTSTCTTAQA